MIAKVQQTVKLCCLHFVSVGTDDGLMSVSLGLGVYCTILVPEECGSGCVENVSLLGACFDESKGFIPPLTEDPTVGSSQSRGPALMETAGTEASPTGFTDLRCDVPLC